MCACNSMKSPLQLDVPGWTGYLAGRAAAGLYFAQMQAMKALRVQRNLERVAGFLRTLPELAPGLRQPGSEKGAPPSLAANLQTLERMG